jgi:glutamate-1-semialdehyde 2,1-aminomutase
MILGHAHPAVTAAIRSQLEKGTTFFALNEPVIRLAQRMVEAIPCGEKIRFTGSGSEAVSFAIRAARAFTGRRKILRFEGAWHGVSDIALFGARPPHSGDFPTATADSAGLAPEVGTDVLVCPFNDADHLARVMADHGAEVAAVVVEPMQRCIRPRDGFLRSLRATADAYGALLVFDEVVTGFRIAWGGAQERYGVHPDLATYGKTITGGLPNAAICGRADVLSVTDPWRPADDPMRTIVSGTFSGYAAGAAAGLATLDLLAAEGTFARLDAIGGRIADEIGAMGREMGIPLLVGGEGPVQQVLFTEESAIVDYGTMSRADKGRAYRFGIELIRRGLLVSPYEKIYLSAVHTDADLDRLLTAARESLPLAASADRE